MIAIIQMCHLAEKKDFIKTKEIDEPHFGIIFNPNECL